MAGKDITEKILEDFPDVFADIVNVLLFGGKQVMFPDDLESMQMRSAYRAEGDIHEIERDVAKRWHKNNVRIACVGFENQSQPDPKMVLRVYGYDGAEYRAQCLKENKDNPPYPVVTIVLYFGYKKRWDQPTELYDDVKIPEILKPFVSNVKINIFEIAWLTDEQVNKFKSDFKIVADYFVQKRKNDNYIPSKEKIQHVHALLQLLSVMENDTRYEEILDAEGEGGIQNMCDVLDKAINKGREEGEKKAVKDMAGLMSFLASHGRTDDIIKAGQDEGFLAKLLAEFRGGMMVTK